MEVGAGRTRFLSIWGPLTSLLFGILIVVSPSPSLWYRHADRSMRHVRRGRAGLAGMPAFAHFVDEPATHGLAWSFEPWVLLSLGVAALLYGLGIYRLYREAARSGCSTAGTSPPSPPA